MSKSKYGRKKAIELQHKEKLLMLLRENRMVFINGKFGVGKTYYFDEFKKDEKVISEFEFKELNCNSKFIEDNHIDYLYSVYNGESFKRYIPFFIVAVISVLIIAIAVNNYIILFTAIAILISIFKLIKDELRTNHSKIKYIEKKISKKKNNIEKRKKKLIFAIDDFDRAIYNNKGIIKLLDFLDKSKVSILIIGDLKLLENGRAVDSSSMIFLEKYIWGIFNFPNKSISDLKIEEIKEISSEYIKNQNIGEYDREIYEKVINFIEKSELSIRDLIKIINALKSEEERLKNINFSEFLFLLTIFYSFTDDYYKVLEMAKDKKEQNILEILIRKSREIIDNNLENKNKYFKKIKEGWINSKLNDIVIYIFKLEKNNIDTEKPRFYPLKDNIELYMPTRKKSSQLNYDQLIDMIKSREINSLETQRNHRVIDRIEDFRDQIIIKNKSDLDDFLRFMGESIITCKDILDIKSVLNKFFDLLTLGHWKGDIIEDIGNIEESTLSEECKLIMFYMFSRINGYREKFQPLLKKILEEDIVFDLEKINKNPLCLIYKHILNTPKEYLDYLKNLEQKFLEKQLKFFIINISNDNGKKVKSFNAYYIIPEATDKNRDDISKISGFFNSRKFLKEYISNRIYADPGYCSIKNPSKERIMHLDENNDFVNLEI